MQPAVPERGPPEAYYARGRVPVKMSRRRAPREKIDRGLPAAVDRSAISRVSIGLFARARAGHDARRCRGRPAPRAAFGARRRTRHRDRAGALQGVRLRLCRRQAAQARTLPRVQGHAPVRTDDPYPAELTCSSLLEVSVRRPAGRVEVARTAGPRRAVPYSPRVMRGEAAWCEVAATAW